MQPLFWGAHAQWGDHHRLSWGSGAPSSAWSLPTCPLSPPAGVQRRGVSGLSLPSLHTLSLWKLQGRRARALCPARPCQEPPRTATFPTVALACLPPEGPPGVSFH